MGDYADTTGGFILIAIRNRARAGVIDRHDRTRRVGYPAHSRLRDAGILGVEDAPIRGRRNAHHVALETLRERVDARFSQVKRDAIFGNRVFGPGVTGRYKA